MVFRQLTRVRTTRYRFYVSIVVATGIVVWGLWSTASLLAAPPAGQSYHDFHRTDQEMVCQDCHVEKQTASPEVCTSCHEAADVHRLLADFRQDAEFHGAPRPPDHDYDFLRAHGAVAGADPSECSVCHEQRFCQDCHEGENLQAHIHPLNYRQIHAFEARGHDEDCLVCHETRDFCVDCHRSNLVLTHPLGASWASGNGGQHQEEAEADLESCLSCHDLGNEDPTCIRPGCHIPGGGDE